MLTGEEYVLRIEKMLNDGKALARYEGFPVFTEDAAPDDLVKVKIYKVNKTYALAENVEIVEKSQSRVNPPCRLFNVCGSCSWQHIDYDEQLRQKELIVKETLEKFAGGEIPEPLPVIPSPSIREYRCKIQLPVSQTKVSKRLMSGYYKKNSHELVNIKYCPMQPDIINEINEFFKERAALLNISGYNEKKHTGLLRHIIYRISSDLKQILVIFVINSDFVPNELYKSADILTEKYKQITGICVNFNTKKTNVIIGDNFLCLKGQDYYVETLNNIKFKISAGSFFQINPKCAVKIFDKVKEIISSNTEKPSILDAYSGVSSFGIWLSEIASKVTCIEEVKSASNDASENIKINNIQNVEIINGDAGAEFEKLAKNNVKFDVSIIDPPRKGSGEEALNALVNLTEKYIVYVSCNPATLARDMKILKSKCFNPVFIQPADMFPNTYHIETIVLFKNNKKEAR